MNYYPTTVAPNRLSSLPEGLAGVRETLAIMVKVVRANKADVGLRTVAQQLVRGCADKDYRCYVTRLHTFVRDKIQYVGDVRGIETLQTPQQTLRIGSGDCDDKAIVLATLLESIGFATRFAAIGVRGGDYSHVLPEVRLGKGFVSLETIVPTATLGWFPPDATRVMRAHV